MTDDLKSLDPQTASVEWYYTDLEGAVYGPITEGRLRQAARSGEVTQGTLIWRQGFDTWREAANVSVTAAIIGRVPNVIEPTAIRRRIEPPKPTSLARAAHATKESQLLEDSQKIESPLIEVLLEAVTDEEAADPIIDLKLAREIVDHASGRAPRPTERSIPPSSVTWHPPPGGAQLVSLLGKRRPLRIMVAFVLSAVAALMLVPRLRSAAVQPSVVAKITTADKPQQPEQPSVPQSTSQSPAPSPRHESSAPVVESEPLVSVDGPLNASLFLRQLKRSQPVFDEQCWDAVRAPGNQVERNPSVRIEMAVDLNGHVYDVKSGKTPLGYHGAGHCIAGRVRGWKFPWAATGTRAVVIVKRVHD